jgi:hypothetical protein
MVSMPRIESAKTRTLVLEEDGEDVYGAVGGESCALSIMQRNKKSDGIGEVLVPRWYLYDSLRV